MAHRKSFLERMLGGESQQAKDQRERESRNVEAHVLRQAKLRAGAAPPPAPSPAPAEVEVDHDQLQAQARLEADLRDQNESLQFHLHRLADVLRDREPFSPSTSERLAAAYRDAGAEAFVHTVQQDLSASPYPPCLPTRTTVLAYRPVARELVLERELPRDHVVPPEQGYRIFHGNVIPVPRPAAELGHRYAELLARVVLRTVAEAFAVTPPALVDRIVLNGRVSTLDTTTGEAIHPHLISGAFGRGTLAQVPLDAPDLDPELCLRQLGAQVSPNPYDLVPVPPIRPPGWERVQVA